MEKEQSAKEFLRFQCNRKITNLFKQCLILLEDLQNPTYNIPEVERQRLRKRILDFGNDARREMDEYFERFDIDFKK
jgi:hypothetical protein